MRSQSKPLRLDPETAGALQHQYNIAVTELAQATRYRKEFDRQLKQLLGEELMQLLHETTENNLLLADLVKEAA